MPSYHCSVKPVQRSSGRSSTAAAAYRAGCNIEDERTGITHDYSRKTGVVDSGMVGWNGSRSELWNAAEQAERRKDATTAREYEIALPRELNQEQQTALTCDYATWIHERHGCAVDWSMHRPDAREHANDNPHAHLLTTTRTVDREGHTLGGKCDRELSDTKRETKGLGPRREDLSEAREVWASIQNQHLERAGISERVDHRSNAERNMDAEPHVHTGPKATAMERRGERTERGDLNCQILELNRQRVETLRELKQLQAESKNLSTEEKAAFGQMQQEKRIEKTVDTAKERVGQTQANRTTANGNAQITKDAEQKHAALKERLKNIEDSKKGVQGEITDRQSRLDRLQKQLDEAKERKNQLDQKGPQTKEQGGEMTRKERLEQTLKEKQQQQGQGQERGGENAELGRKERLEQTLNEKQEQKPQEAGKEDKGRKGKDEDMSL
jgi:chromosome segregation ATPase